MAFNHRKPSHQHRQRHLRQLPRAQDRIDYIRRQQGQAQDATHVGLVDFLSGCDLRNRRMRAILKHFAPGERPSDGLDHGLVDVPALGAQDWRVVRRFADESRMRPLYREFARTPS
jgi:hypothetical protein